MRSVTTTKHPSQPLTPLMPEYLRDAEDETLAIRRTQPNEQDAAVRPGSESPHVRKIQILRNQESSFLLCRLPNLAVALATQVLLGNGVKVVA